VSSASVSGSGASGSRRPLVITLAVIGVLAVVYAVLCLAVKGLPSFLTLYTTAKGHDKTHPFHAVVALVVAVALFVGAWFASKSSSVRS
jgi:hypothetical protein